MSALRTRRLIDWPGSLRVPFALLLCFSSGCDLPGRPKAADRASLARDEQSFDFLFRRNCAGCHGVDAKLGPAPPLNDKLFLALVSDGELKQVVSGGRPGTLMPAFAANKGGQLTAEQVSLIAEGIKVRWGGPAGSAPTDVPPLRLESARPVAQPDVAAGLKAFARACASCHGDRGQGGTYAGKSDGQPVGAINIPEFVALASDQVLRRLIITGRPDLGMPDCRDGQGRPQGFKPLTSAEVTEIVALMASWREVRTATGKGN